MPKRINIDEIEEEIKNIAAKFSFVQEIKTDKIVFGFFRKLFCDVYKSNEFPDFP